MTVGLIETVRLKDGVNLIVVHAQTVLFGRMRRRGLAKDYE